MAFHFQSESKPPHLSIAHQEIDIESNSSHNATCGLTHAGDTLNTTKNVQQYHDDGDDTGCNNTSRRKPSLVAVLNHSLATLGEKLCKHVPHG